MDIPFEDSHFDIVIANHLLFYIEDRDRVYQEILRVLKPGGFFIASTYGPKHMEEITTLVQEFHPSITLADKELYEIFGLQNGAEELRSYFSNVTTRYFEDGLLVSNPDLLLEYIISCHGNQNEYLLPKYQEFKEMLTRKLKKKPFSITKEAGLFVCKK
jgi:SAM-dependent methyltransferase